MSDSSTSGMGRLESDFHDLVKFLLDRSGIDIESEYRLGNSQKSMDLYLPEYDTAVELKTNSDQRKGIGQALDYLTHHSEAILLVPEGQYDPNIARIADNSGVGYGYVSNYNFKFSIYGIVPFGFWDPINKDLVFEYGPLPEMGLSDPYPHPDTDRSE